jgi:hypothetical protein
VGAAPLVLLQAVELDPMRFTTKPSIAMHHRKPVVALRTLPAPVPGFLLVTPLRRNQLLARLTIRRGTGGGDGLAAAGAPFPTVRPLIIIPTGDDTRDELV